MPSRVQVQTANLHIADAAGAASALAHFEGACIGIGGLAELRSSLLSSTCTTAAAARRARLARTRELQEFTCTADGLGGVIAAPLRGWMSDFLQIPALPSKSQRPDEVHASGPAMVVAERLQRPCAELAVKAAASKQRNSASLRQDMLSFWQRKHQLIRHSECPQLGKVASQYSACWLAGQCVCSPTGKLQQRARSELMRAIREAPFTPQQFKGFVDQGFTVLCLTGAQTENGQGERSESVRFWLHLSLCFGAAKRPTFWLMEGPRPLEVLPQTATLRPICNDTGEPKVMAALEFVAAHFDLEARWSLDLYRLSSGEAPLVSVAPQALVAFREHGIDTKVVWPPPPPPPKAPRAPRRQPPRDGASPGRNGGRARGRSGGRGRRGQSGNDGGDVSMEAHNHSDDAEASPAVLADAEFDLGAMFGDSESVEDFASDGDTDKSEELMDLAADLSGVLEEADEETELPAFVGEAIASMEEMLGMPSEPRCNRDVADEGEVHRGNALGGGVASRVAAPEVPRVAPLHVAPPGVPAEAVVVVDAPRGLGSKFARRAAARGPALENFEFEGGVTRIKETLTETSVCAHCTLEGHGGPCQCRRTRTLKAGRRAGQGRPLGHLLAWLALGSEAPDKESHCSMPVPDIGLRRFAREQALGNPANEALFAAEAPVEGDDAAEPEVVI